MRDWGASRGNNNVYRLSFSLLGPLAKTAHGLLFEEGRHQQRKQCPGNWFYKARCCVGVLVDGGIRVVVGEKAR